MFYQHYAPLGLMRYISGKALLYMQHFDTLDQRNARTHISHIALLARLKKVVIGNGGSTFLCVPSWRVGGWGVGG